MNDVPLALPGQASPEVLTAATGWANLVGPELQAAFDVYAERVLAGLRRQAPGSYAGRRRLAFVDEAPGPAQVSNPGLVVSDAEWLAAVDSVALTVAVEDGYLGILTVAADEAPVELLVPKPDRVVREHLREIRSWAPGFSRDVAEIVAAGVRDGRSSDRIAEDLTKHVRGVNGKRGQNIARTEANAAQNAGRTTVADATGLDYQRAWSATPDARVRYDHAWANGQVRDAGQPFTVGGYRCQYPGDTDLPPEQRARCRCTTSLVYGRFDPAEVREAANEWRRRVAEIAAVDGMALAPDLAALVGR